MNINQTEPNEPNEQLAQPDEPMDGEMKEDEEERPVECLSEANLPNEGDHEAPAKNGGDSIKKSANQKTVLAAMPLSRVAGHTGFLTVATKL